jgi:serine/threonine protein kinase
MFAGLEYLHSENVVHNDIKPPNILLFKRGNRIVVKYSDFGCPPPPPSPFPYLHICDIVSCTFLFSVPKLPHF